MYYAYRLKSEKYPDRNYVGHTSDLKQRPVDHNRGHRDATRPYATWRVEFYAAFETEALAIAFESYLKTASGKAFGKKRLWTKT